MVLVTTVSPRRRWNHVVGQPEPPKTFLFGSLMQPVCPKEQEQKGERAK